MEDSHRRSHRVMYIQTANPKLMRSGRERFLVVLYRLVVCFVRVLMRIPVTLYPRSSHTLHIPVVTNRLRKCVI